MTPIECFAKAEEMDRRSADPLAKQVSGDYRVMAEDWRKLAVRALVDEELETAFKIGTVGVRP